MQSKEQEQNSTAVVPTQEHVGGCAPRDNELGDKLIRSAPLEDVILAEIKQAYAFNSMPPSEEGGRPRRAAMKPVPTKVFTLRMPQNLHESVSGAAWANGRSINAEINERLKGSFLNSVSGRLDWLLAHLREKALQDHVAPFTLSILAEQIGEESVGRLERVVAGLEEPPFSLLDTLAAHCAVNPAWLKHGVGKPFDPVPLSHEQGDAP